MRLSFLLPLLIVLPLLTAFLIPLIDILAIALRKILVIISISLELVFSLSLLFYFSPLGKEKLPISYYLGGWEPPLGISLSLNHLGLIFSMLVSVSLFLITLYSLEYIEHHEGKYYVLLFVVLGAMQGVVLTNDLFNLYVFIELLTVASTPLVAFDRTSSAIEAGIKYIVYGLLGGLFFFIGIVLIYLSLGTLSLAEIALSFSSLPIPFQETVLIFFIISLTIKLGIFPFHFWLAKAHSSAPAPISALLSGVMLKLYLCVFLRLFWVVLDFPLMEASWLKSFVLYLALGSSLLGHLFAFQEEDLKRLLAFSSVGHIGIIVAVLLVNTPEALYGGMLHIINHLIMKSALFLDSGYFLQFTKSHLIKDLKGVFHYNRYLFASFVIVVLAMIGIPPLNGFFSKWYMLLAFVEEGIHLGGIVVILGSLLAIPYYFRVISYGISPCEEKPVVSLSQDPPPASLMIFTILALVVLTVVTGIFYFCLNPILDGAVQELLPLQIYPPFPGGS
ncbi:MAG: multicomponent Na+:H+ antiporter subunit [Candidatus Atribacteria bacterium]|nr:multicomponent Na+:H+ antiporter subunit [Candidatus Atribacteria bacterium]